MAGSTRSATKNPKLSTARNRRMYIMYIIYIYICIYYIYILYVIYIYYIILYFIYIVYIIYILCYIYNILYYIYMCVINKRYDITIYRYGYRYKQVGKIFETTNHSKTCVTINARCSERGPNRFLYHQPFKACIVLRCQEAGHHRRLDSPSRAGCFNTKHTRILWFKSFCSTIFSKL